MSRKFKDREDQIQVITVKFSDGALMTNKCVKRAQYFVKEFCTDAEGRSQSGRMCDMVPKYSLVTGHGRVWMSGI